MVAAMVVGMAEGGEETTVEEETMVEEEMTAEEISLLGVASNHQIQVKSPIEAMPYTSPAFELTSRLGESCALFTGKENVITSQHTRIEHLTAQCSEKQLDPK